MAAVGRADRLPSGPKTCNRGPEHHDPGRHPERAFPPSPFALLARGLHISPLSGQVKPSSTSNETRTRYRYEKGLAAPAAHQQWAAGGSPDGGGITRDGRRVQRDHPQR
ncbi:hypothetical protein K525DRAFT_275008 [Schizophyllum commune Loenen D]|nr:hypothetical protein K525DRAFT_275008 [Schizophyllum commune Loenen D]